MIGQRVQLPIEGQRPQFAAHLSSPTRSRGHPPRRGPSSPVVAVAPAPTIHRIADLAPKAAPGMEPGVLLTGRQFGLLEPHADAMAELDATGAAILRGIGAPAADQLAPRIPHPDIVEELSDRHAIIVGRSRDGSILVPGVAPLIHEAAPALFARVAADEAERAAPGAVLDDARMMGATGHIFLSGPT